MNIFRKIKQFFKPEYLFFMLKIFFNDIVIKDLIESIYPKERVKQLMRQHVIDEILKKK